MIRNIIQRAGIHILRRPLFIAALLQAAALMTAGFLIPQALLPKLPLQSGEKIVLAGIAEEIRPAADGIRVTVCDGRYILEEILKETLKGTSGHRDVSFSFDNDNAADSGEITGIAGNNMRRLSGKVFVYLDSADFRIGETLFVRGMVREFETPSNPGQFDVRLYYQNRGILFGLTDSTVIHEGYVLRPSFFTRISLMMASLRERLGVSLSGILGAEDAGMMRLSLLGDRDAADPDLRDLLLDTGMSRLVHTSGMYLSLLGMGLFKLLRKRRYSFVMCALLSGLPVFGYGMTAGMGTGLSRALIAFMIWCGAQILGRAVDLPTSLGLASAVVLTHRPSLIMDAGYVLSFGSVLSIIMFSPGLEVLLFKCIQSKGERGSFRKIVAAGLAAVIGTLPLTEWYFYQITPLALLLQIPLFMMQRITFVMGMAGAGAGLIFPPAGRFIAAPCHFILTAVRRLSSALLLLPGNMIITGRPHPAAVLAYYCGVFFLLRRVKLRISGSKNTSGRMKLLHLGLFAVGYSFMILLTMIRFTPPFRIIFLDVGQGETILVQSERRSILIDCGSSSTEGIWGKRVSGTLRYYGIRKLDAAFVTHADDDHINGLKELLSDYTVNLAGRNAADISLQAIACSKEAFAASSGLRDLAGKAGQKGIETLLIGKGETVLFGKAKLTDLFPNESDVRAADGDLNQSSLVLLLSGPGLQVLLTGDLELQGEQRLTERITADVPALDRQRRILKVAHHGSRNATSEELLTAFAPDLAVVSCGAHNRYGHPSEQVLLRLHEREIPLLRTDQDGAVVITVPND